MKLSIPEIIAALQRVTNNEPGISKLDLTGPHATKFVALCRYLYTRGFDHGYSEGKSDAAPAAVPIPEEEIATWQSVPIFAGVDPDQLRWIVRKTEERHGITSGDRG